jgi:hypothetical protein
MRRFLILACAVLLPLGAVVPAEEAADRVTIRKAFIMAAAEDGTPSRDSFEVWDTVCTLGPSPIPGDARCSVTAVTLTAAGGETHVFTWRHDSQFIREIQPGLFRIEMNGRWTDCSGLQVLMRLQRDSAIVENIEGSMRAGSSCQSNRTFTLDVAAPTRALSPISNPAYRSR